MLGGMKSLGPWVQQNRAELFRNDFLVLEEDSVRKPDGSEGRYATVTLKRGVGIVALDRQEHVYLVQQFRYPIERESLEVICGGQEKGEDSESAAQRELREEAGISVSSLVSLGPLDIDTSVLRAPMELYLGYIDRVERSSPEGSERLSLQRLPFATALAMATDARITHGPSCVALFRARELLRR